MAGIEQNPESDDNYELISGDLERIDGRLAIVPFPRRDYGSAGDVAIAMGREMATPTAHMAPVSGERILRARDWRILSVTDGDRMLGRSGYDLAKLIAHRHRGIGRHPVGVGVIKNPTWGKAVNMYSLHKVFSRSEFGMLDNPNLGLVVIATEDDVQKIMKLDDRTMSDRYDRAKPDNSIVGFALKAYRGPKDKIITRWNDILHVVHTK